VEVLPLQEVARALGRSYVGCVRGVRRGSCGESYRVRHAGFVPRRGGAARRGVACVVRLWACLRALLRVLASGPRVRFLGGVSRAAAASGGGARCGATGRTAAESGRALWRYECACEYGGGGSLRGASGVACAEGLHPWVERGGGVCVCSFVLERGLCELVSAVVDVAFHAELVARSAASSSAVCNRYVACRGVLAGARSLRDGENFAAASFGTVVSLHAALRRGCAAVEALCA
jgi:hypothetical protein